MNDAFHSLISAAMTGAPVTGGSLLLLLVSFLSGIGITALNFIDRKGRHSRYGSKH